MSISTTRRNMRKPTFQSNSAMNCHQNILRPCQTRKKCRSWTTCIGTQNIRVCTRVSSVACLSRCFNSASSWTSSVKTFSKNTSRGQQRTINTLRMRVCSTKTKKDQKNFSSGTKAVCSTYRCKSSTNGRRSDRLNRL